MVMGSPSTQESSPRGPRVATRAESRNSGTWDELALENVSMTFNPGKPNEYRALANTTIKVFGSVAKAEMDVGAVADPVRVEDRKSVV